MTKEEAKETLKKLFKNNREVFTAVTHVSRSGMFRKKIYYNELGCDKVYFYDTHIFTNYLKGVE